jgi:hypothetical protein
MFMDQDFPRMWRRGLAMRRPAEAVGVLASNRVSTTKIKRRGLRATYVYVSGYRTLAPKTMPFGANRLCAVCNSDFLNKA